MKRIIYVLLVCMAFTLSLFTQQGCTTPPLTKEKAEAWKSLSEQQPTFVQVIPQPRQTQLLDGAFDFRKGVNIICNKELNDIASIFNERLTVTKGITFPIQSKGKTNGNITLKITPEIIEKEG